jgi:phosphoglycolate phosphatase
LKEYTKKAMSLNFSSVIFDFDYTLADSSKGVIECVNYAFRTMNLPEVSEAVIRGTIGVSLRETFRILTQEAHENRSDEFNRLFTERADEVMLDRIALFDSVKPTIEKLVGSGLTLGIVSTKFRYRIEAFLQRENIADSFKVVVGGEDVIAHKPDPTGLRMVIDRLGNTPSNVVYVGDSVVDAETAKRASMPFVAVLSGVTSKTAFRGYAPLAIIDNLRSLPQLVLNH